MDLKQVIEKSKALQKATAAQDPPENIIRILNELKTGVTADEALLRRTKIGIIVNRSKQHMNPPVARLASEIVKKWRDDVQKAKGGSPAHKKSPSGTSSPVPSNTSTDKPKVTVPPAERDWKKEKVNVDRTHQATRDKCIGLLYNGLAFMTSAPSSEVLEKAEAVEAAGFDKYGPESNTSYSTTMRSLYLNLKAKSNPKLRADVMDGSITPEKLVLMSSHELASAERRAENKKIEQEVLKASEVLVTYLSLQTY